MINVFGEFLFFGKRDVANTDIHVIDLGTKSEMHSKGLNV